MCPLSADAGSYNTERGIPIDFPELVDEPLADAVRADKKAILALLGKNPVLRSKISTPWQPTFSKVFSYREKDGLTSSLWRR